MCTQAGADGLMTASPGSSETRVPVDSGVLGAPVIKLGWKISLHGGVQLGIGKHGNIIRQRRFIAGKIV